MTLEEYNAQVAKDIQTIQDLCDKVNTSIDGLIVTMEGDSYFENTKIEKDMIKIANNLKELVNNVSRNVEKIISE